MKTFVQAITAAEQFSTKKEKFEALSGMDSLSVKLVEEALNPYRQFNVKKWPKSSYSSEDASYQTFIDMLDVLQKRTVTGNNARNLVSTTLGYYTENTAKYLARVLGKDLKCGASLTTFKKIYPEIDIIEFEIMLASKVDAKYKWKFPIQLSQKLDGTRLIAIVENGIVQYFSRSGKPSDHCDGLFDDELSSMEKHLGYPFVLDGEALASSYKETMNAKGGDNSEAKAALRFYAFDIMSLQEWKNQNCSKKQAQRTKELDSIIETLNLKKIMQTKTKVVNTFKEAKDFYEEILASGINDDGTINGLGEGLIVKNLDGIYEFERSAYWHKWKPIIDVDLKITGFYKGNINTKNQDKLGGFYVEGFDENGNFIKSECGGLKVSAKTMKPLIDYIANQLDVQFDDDRLPNYVSNKDQMLRRYIWENQEEFLGKTIMIECQELTTSDSDYYSLRFPIFVGMRPDKDI